MSSSSNETEQQIKARTTLETTHKTDATAAEFWRGHALREGRVVSSAHRTASEDVRNSEMKLVVSKRKLKALKRQTVGREMGRESVNVTTKPVSEDKEAAAARAENAAERADVRQARKSGLKGEAFSSKLHVVEYLSAIDRKSFSDVATMRLANDQARPLSGEKTLVSSTAATVRVQKREIRVASGWPPSFRSDEVTGLHEWTSRQVICKRNISLSRVDEDCVVIMGDNPIGKWRVTRSAESDVKSNLLSVALWGTADVTVKAYDLTPDAYHDGNAYDMKVRSTNPMAGVVSAMSKYKNMSREMVRVVVYTNGRVLSNYDWSQDGASRSSGEAARGWDFACMVSQLNETVRAFSNLFGDVGIASSREVEALGSGKAYHTPGRETNNFDFVKEMHHAQMEVMAKRSKDGLDLASVMAEPDDSQEQHAAIERYLSAMGKLTSAGNEYLDEAGGFKQKMSPVPLVGYVAGYRQDLLNRPNSDVRPPKFTAQKEGTTEKVIELICAHINAVVDAGKREGASDEEKNAMMAWTSANPKEQYAKSGRVEKLVDQEAVESLMAELMNLEENSHELSHQEQRSKMSAVHAKIEETVLMDKEKRVKRSRRLMTGAPVRIGAESKGFEHSDAVTSTFIEGPYHFRKRQEKREAEALHYDLYLGAQKNLPYVQDVLFDNYMKRNPGESICPKTAADRLAEEMGVRSVSKDGNYDLLFGLDKVTQEVSASMGHSTGTGIFVKMVPHTAMIVLFRNSGKQSICTLLADSRVHTFDEDRWWTRMEGSVWRRSKFFTINRAKASIYLNGEERHRVVCFMRSQELEEDTHLTADERRTSLEAFSNLSCMILCSQKQPDSVVLSYARYIGMILQNNCVNRGQVKELFTKVERIKTRLSLWTLKKFSEWVRMREAGAVMDGVKSNWEYRCWLTGLTSRSSSSRLTMFYVGNMYEKTLGERAAAIRGPFNKLLELAYSAADRKGVRGPERVNQICEELEDYDRHFQVDWGLLRKVLDESFAQHKREHPDWKTGFESTLIGLTKRVDGAELATRRASFWHTSDDLVDGFVTRSKKSGRVTDTQHRMPNWNEKMQTMVVEYPNLLMGRPFTNFRNLVHPVRSNVVPKKQLQGKREILVVTPGARVSIASMEMTMRAFATGMDNEVLTNKNKEAKISSYASGVNYRKMALERSNIPFRHVVSRSSADATKWCQLFRMPVFVVMVKVIFGEDYKNLFEHCSAVLEEHTKKKIQIPASIVREIESGSAFTEEGIRRLAREFEKDTEIHLRGECMIRIVDNMLQGILHYTSSVYHSLIQNYFTERAKDALNEAIMEKALNYFLPDRKEEARTALTLFNSRFERIQKRERQMYEDGRPSEEIAEEVGLMRQEASDSRSLLSGLLMGESKKSGLVPSWSVTYQNAASSDDTSIAIDVILTGPSAFLTKGGDVAESVLSKLMVAKRRYYKRLGVEESTSKSSVGNFKDVMEFNSKWYEGPIVVDVWLKAVLSAMMAPPPTGFSEMQNHYVNGRSAVIAAGGSVELAQQIRIAQAVGHQKILGCDMSDMFEYLEEDIRKNPHVLLGKFEYEKNNALCGLLPSFLIHYQWLGDSETRKTEQALSMTVQHEMDPSGVMALGIRVEVGNGLRSKESMLKSKKLLDKFQAGVLGGDDPKEALEEHAMTFLTNSASPTARLLLELIRDTKRPIETDVSATSVYKLSTLLITSPCLSVTIPNAENARGPGVTFRMSLPSLHKLVVASKAIEAKKPEEDQRPVRLVEALDESKGYSDQLMSLRVTKSQGKAQSMANRAVSSTKQTLSGVPAEIDLRLVLFRVWSGSTVDPQTLNQFKILKGMFPDLRETMEETLTQTASYAPTKMDLVLHFMKDTNLVHNIRSRSGTSLAGSGLDALIKVLEMQSFHGIPSSVSVLKGKATREEGLSNFRYEANMRTLFTDDTSIVDYFLRIRFPSTNLEAGSRDMRLMEWARSLVARGSANHTLLARASAKQIVVISEGSKGMITLILGSAILRLLVEQREESSVVKSMLCNCTSSTVKGILRAYKPEKKKWLSWEGLKRDEPNHDMWFNPGSGVSSEQHKGSVPIYTQKHIEVAPFFDAVKAETRRYGESIMQRLRVHKEGNRWDFVDLTLPVGTITSEKVQEARLLRYCAESAVSFRCIDRYCRGEQLDHGFLNDGFSGAKNRWLWKWLTLRAVELVQSGWIAQPSWDEAYASERMRESILLVKGAQTELIRWTPGQMPPEDLEGFEEYMERRQKRLRGLEVSEEDMQKAMEFSQKEGEYDDDEMDAVLTYIDYQAADDTRLESFDPVLDDKDSLVEYMDMTTTETVRSGVDVGAFARSLIGIGERPAGDDPFPGARYILTAQKAPDEDDEEDGVY